MLIEYTHKCSFRYSVSVRAPSKEREGMNVLKFKMLKKPFHYSIVFYPELKTIFLMKQALALIII